MARANKPNPDARLIVPELDDPHWPSLGGEVCDFIEDYLVHGPGDVLGEPVTLTNELRAFIWRAYEVFPRGHARAGRRRFKRVALSRRKGVGKTEVAAWLAIVEMDPEGPVRCDGWRKEDGMWVPVGRPVRDPYIPMIAVTEGQAEDLAYGAVFAILSNDNCALGDNYDLGIEKEGRPPEKITHRTAPGKIQALASAPSSRDGARTTFQHADEPHLFFEPRLVKSWTTMLRNMPKRKAADPWALETTTSYEPGADSVAEGTHKYALEIAAGRIKDATLLYDHRQASEKWDLEDPDQLLAAVREASGDAWAFADGPSILSQFDDPQNDEAELRRYWLNQPRRSSRRWFVAGRFERLKKKRPTDGEIVLGFAGSYDRGCTVLYGATVDPKPHVFEIETWERPATAPPGWRPNIRDVIDAVGVAMATRQVRELAVVPTGWRTEVEDWEAEFGEEMLVRYELNRSSVWGPACDEFEQAVNGSTLTHDGSEVLMRHVGQATTLERTGYKVLESPPPAAAVAAVIAHSRARWHTTNEAATPFMAWT